MDLVVATTNRGKFQEIQNALKDQNLSLLFLKDLPAAPSVKEDQDTFEGNARKKADVICRWSGKPTLADDSGLVIPALEGRPGVYSARYAGEHATDEQNRQKVLGEMRDVPEEKRRAHFICHLAVVFPDSQKSLQVEGRCDGRILFTPRGEKGFGYDPIFYLPSLGKTLAELSLVEKNQVSHRGQALHRLFEAFSKMNGHSFRR